MKRKDRIALALVMLILVGLPLAALGYQYGLRPRLADTRVIEIEAAIPEKGGFQPSAIEVQAGERVTLRFSSLDVTHGVAIGPGLNIDLGHVDPGKIEEITLTFDKPGVYTYYCNSWCSPNHWRMRGTITVTDPADPNAMPAPQRDPVIEGLIAEGVDIDSAAHGMADGGEHPYTVEFPLALRPSFAAGGQIIGDLAVPAELSDAGWRQSHTPIEALERLAADNPGVPVSDLADAVAYLWTRDGLTPDEFQAAQRLYNKNCAACHGENGEGDGPGAAFTAEDPAAFADFNYLFERRSDVLYAKIRRGGMGTDMPNFGTVFTPEETWLLVRYLWLLAFE